MIQDNRPIKPSQEFLKQQEQFKERIVPHQTNYLKRSSGKYLPCFSETRLKTHEPISKQEPTKKEIYERMKSENQALFGKRKKKIQIKVPQTQQIKIKKPKQRKNDYSMAERDRFINVEEQPIPTPSNKKTDNNKALKAQLKHEQKDKYERLIKQMQRQRQLLKREREEFEEEKVLLQFRKQIKNEEGIKPKRIYRGSEYFKCSSKDVILGDSKTKNGTLTSAMNKGKMIDSKRSLSSKRNFKTDLVQSKKLIENISQKIIQIQKEQDKIYYASPLKSPRPILQLESLPLITNFNVDIFNHQGSQDILIHTNNKYYRQFLNRQRSLKIVDQRKQGKSQIIKYQDGSFTKDAKKYRIVQFPNGYRLTFFQNHDVKQQIPGGIICYYSKIKGVNKISFSPSFDIYYFYQQKQLQIHYKPSCRKQIKYKNGMKRTVIDPQM